MSDKSKLVYICSPYATGDVEENVCRAREYCRLALKNGYIPVAPHLLYPQFLRDEDPEEREQGLSCGLALLDVCAEVWVFGQISKGMLREIEYAENKNIPVLFQGKEQTEKDVLECNVQRALLRRELTAAFQVTETQGDINPVVTFLLANGVREVAHGCWKKRLNTTESPDYTFFEWYCSVCECVCEDADKKPTYQYCPACGAEMDMEDNNED